MSDDRATTRSATSPTAGACCSCSLVFVGAVAWAFRPGRRQLPTTQADIPFKNDDRRTDDGRRRQARRIGRAQTSGVEIDPVTGSRPPATTGTASRNSTRRCRAGGCGRSTPRSSSRSATSCSTRRCPLLARRRPRGVLGYSTRAAVADDIAAARAGPGRCASTRSPTLPLDEIAPTADLTRFAVAGGRSAFQVNCVQCHGSGAAGSHGLSQPQRRRLAVGRRRSTRSTRRSPHGIRFAADAETRDLGRCRPSAPTAS